MAVAPSFPAPYKVSRRLGQGGFGQAWLVRHEIEDRLYVCKEVSLPSSFSAEKRSRVVNEAKLLSDFDHPCIVKYHGSCPSRDGSTLYIFMKYYDQGDVRSVLEGGSVKINSTRLKSWIAQLLLGLAYLHKKNILHRDIKPDNILVDVRAGSLHEHTLLVYADFGMAKMIHGRDQHTQGGTPGFFAPEVAEGRPFDFKADIYSLGRTLQALLTKDLDPNGAFRDDAPEDAQAFIRRMLSPNPADRPTIGELLRDDYGQACLRVLWSRGDANILSVIRDPDPIISALQTEAGRVLREITGAALGEVERVGEAMRSLPYSSRRGFALMAHVLGTSVMDPLVVKGLTEGSS